MRKQVEAARAHILATDPLAYAALQWRDILARGALSAQVPRRASCFTEWPRCSARAAEICNARISCSRGAALPLARRGQPLDEKLRACSEGR